MYLILLKVSRDATFAQQKKIMKPYLKEITTSTGLIVTLLLIFFTSEAQMNSGKRALAKLRKECDRKNSVDIRSKVAPKLIPCTNDTRGEHEHEKHGHGKSPQNNLSADQKIALWQQVDAMPTDQDGRSVNTWQFVGPQVTQTNSSSGLVTGRVNAMEYIRSSDPTNSKLIVGAASGGVWMLNNYGSGWQPTSLHSNLNTLNVGYVTQSPADENEFLLGTGEEGGSSGTGLYKTTNNGATWQPCTLPGSVPDYFTKIVYDQANPDTIHAASNYGYYRSTDGGNTWAFLLAGVVTDLVVNPIIPFHIIIYDAVLGGLMESTDYGSTFTTIPSVPFNPSNTGNVKLAFAQSAVGRLYASAVKSLDGNTFGIFRSNNAGAAWTQCPTLPVDMGGNYYNFHWQQGNYNNCISVSPVNPDFVLAGGGALMKSYDGTNFDVLLFNTGNYHADVHSIAFSETASDIFIATDGGIYHSTDGANSFNANYNRVPATQFYDIDVSGNNLVHLIGSTQDNGTMVATYSAGNMVWNDKTGSDGWNSARSDNQPNDAVAIYGFPAENSYLAFTSNAGNTWSISGIPAACVGKGMYVAWERSSTQQWPYIDAPLLGCGNGLYFRDIFNALTQLNPTAFPGDVIGVAVSNRASAADNNNIYVPIIGGGAVKIMKRDRITGNFADISNGLIQTPTEWYRVHTHANNFDEAYAVPSLTPGKIYRTTNAGTNWVDVSGNLPPIIFNAATGHPTNSQIMFAAANDYGIFRTDDGGANWYRWENGLPKGISVSFIEFIDSTAINGKAYLVAGTYGRGIWQRDASGEEPLPSAVTQPDQIIAKLISSASINSQNLMVFWQPMNKMPIIYSVTDLTGKTMRSGESSDSQMEIDMAEYATGIYFLRATQGNHTETVKLHKQ